VKPKKGLTQIAYDVCYGEETAAAPGMVMFRITANDKVLADLNMPPEQFLDMAHAIENVARAVAEFTQPKD
jgi:hypothetical protein